MKPKENSSYSQKILFLLFTVFLSLSFAGCLSFRTHPAGMEPQAYEIKKKNYEIVEHSNGQSSSFRLFWFIPVTDRADFNRAIDNAIHRKGGDNLINVRMWYEKQYWILGTVNVLTVEGDVIRYKD